VPGGCGLHALVVQARQLMEVDRFLTTAQDIGMTKGVPTSGGSSDAPPCR